MNIHRVSLSGSASRGNRISATVLADLLEVLVPGARASVRLRAEGRSTAKGADPAWLVQAADFEVTGFFEGSTVVELSARPLSEALPSKFGQQSLFESPNIGEMTALDAFQESVNLAESGADSDLYDDGFLAICLKMRDVLSHGFDGITVEGKQRKTGINSAKLESISNLRTRLPRPSRTNLVGKLDSVSHTDGHFNLDLPDGTRVRGIPAESIAEELNGFWGQQVFVQGIATFHASGKLSHIDAEMIQNATPGQSAVWSKLPRPLAHAGQQNLLQNQGPRSGLAKIMGRWPGEESDEQIEELLKGIS